MKEWQIVQMQNLPLEVKVEKTKQRIKEWYEHFNGEVYISFSGGKDSTVLADIARSIYPNIELVFVDTGLEYPEIKEFVKSYGDVTILKPKYNFKQVLEKYGYPIISKEQAQFIRQYRTAKSEKTKHTRIHGNKWGLGKISKKWLFLLDAPFKIDDRCCDIMKKNPFKKFEKETGKHPILGTMASESNKRKQDYIKFGCNSFNATRPTSKPLGFWLESDVLEYLNKYNIKFASVYGEIVETENGLKLTGADRTGCMFCMLGVHKETGINRFQRMYKTHPKLHKYCIDDLGLGKVLDYLDVKY